jgi:hypothetical protein
LLIVLLSALVSCHVSWIVGVSGFNEYSAFEQCCRVTVCGVRSIWVPFTGVAMRVYINIPP